MISVLMGYSADLDRGETETVIHRYYCVPRTLMTMTRGCIGNRRTYLIDLTLDPTEAWIN